MIGFFLDYSLLVPLVGNFLCRQKSDGSSDPVIYHVYLGDPDSSYYYQAHSDPGVDPIQAQVVNVLEAWQADTVYSVGDAAQPTTSNGYRYQVSAIAGGGQSGSTEPETWPTTYGETVADNEVTWKCTGTRDEVTEVTMAATLEGLDTATPGDPLSLGTVIDGGAENAVDFYIRLDDDDLTLRTSIDLKVAIGEMDRVLVA